MEFLWETGREALIVKNDLENGIIGVIGYVWGLLEHLW